jgi:hypothetical protein
MAKELDKKVEVKEFFETDRCEFCDSLQGGYVDGDFDRYINIRDGHECVDCGVPETPL